MRRWLAAMIVLMSCCEEAPPAGPTSTWNCNPLSISERALSVPAGGGSFTLQVTAHPTCPWTPSPGAAASFVTMTSPGLTGSGPLEFVVAANPGAARSGFILVHSPNFVVKPIFISASVTINQAGR